jgi:hypothetical protein
MVLSTSRFYAIDYGFNESLWMEHSCIDVNHVVQFSYSKKSILVDGYLYVSNQIESSCDIQWFVELNFLQHLIMLKLHWFQAFSPTILSSKLLPGSA